MSIHVYTCNECAKNFNHLLGVIKIQEELRCPDCGGKKLEKQLSSFGISGSSRGGSDCSSCSSGNCSSCG